jgi:phosphopantothenoylcysteine decarboxylase/phosphopantothenate--cysteine ligase
MLKGKVVILGVTGGIAAYKAVELLRLLTKAGADVHVIMTEGAMEFVAPLTFQTLSMNPVATSLFNLLSEREIGHIALADRADLMVIAPATANTVGKISNGIADDMLTTTAMATKAPILIAPAMNVNMYQSPAYRDNEARLKSRGVLFAEPVKGTLACGWEGEGKLQEPQVIFQEVVAALSKKDLSGERILVTAGPTREEIDPVRFISNHSSGKMGYSIAAAARRRGADVTLVTGPASVHKPYGVEIVPVVSAREMREAVMSRAIDCSVIIKAAAVADYRPAERSGKKIKKGAAPATLELVRNPDILEELGKVKGESILVGFAAETEDLLRNARSKLKRKNLDMIVANDVSRPGAGFDGETNMARLIFRDGRSEELPLMSKDEMADIILDRIVELKRGR